MNSKKTTIMLTKDNYKKITELANRLAVSKSAALRLLISNVVKNNIQLKKARDKKEVRFTFVSAKDYPHFQELQKQYKDMNVTELLNNVIATSYQSFKIF